jgi:uncharacterized OB-fold protein
MGRRGEGEVMSSGSKDVEKEKKEVFLEFPGRWDIPYVHSAGRAATKFFTELKNKKIVGTKCPKCSRVLIPPRSFCERCFVPTTDWVEVKDTGVITTFTICYVQFTGLPKPPYALGGVKLEGADTSLFWFIGGVPLGNQKEDYKKMPIGSRAKAVWNEERKGAMSDIKYFKPIGT